MWVCSIFLWRSFDAFFEWRYGRYCARGSVQLWCGTFLCPLSVPVLSSAFMSFSRTVFFGARRHLGFSSFLSKDEDDVKEEQDATCISSSGCCDMQYLWRRPLRGVMYNDESRRKTGFFHAAWPCIGNSSSGLRWKSSVNFYYC